MNLRSEVSKSLIAHGFKRSGRMHLRRLDSEFSFWVDTGPIGKRTDIAPFAGLRHDGVETLFGELLGVPQDPLVGIVGANVGYVLSGEYRRWDTPSGVDEVLQAILSALEQFRPFTSLRALPGAWEISRIEDPGKWYRLTVIWLLLGDTSRLRDYLELARAEYCKDDDDVCKQFRHFEARIGERVQAYRTNIAADGSIDPDLSRV